MTSREGRLCRDEYTGIIAGGSVYGGTCQPALVHFVKAHLGTLQQVPSALFSVSPHAALTDDENQQEARRYVDTFLGACRAFGWKREDDEMFVQHDTTFEARSGATGRKSGILTGGQLTAATPDR